MPRAPSSIADLARVLGASERPVYVLDDQRRIVYCNAACAAWVGQPIESLVGQHCAYHSQAAEPAAAAAAELCPPPQVFLGEQVTAVISHVLGAASVYRRGDFWPLGDGAVGTAAVVAILAATDEPPASAAAGSLADAADESSALHDALRQFRRQAAARHDISQLVGVSPASVKARAQADLAARAARSVLIAGPRGSGKGHLAKAIHYCRAGESEAALLPVDCAVVGAGLLISTVTAWLARGSATLDGAQLETLLLEDVDRIPAESQFELTRLVRSAPAQSLVVATTERSLPPLVATGTFRADLASVLSTLVIELPALAERAEDVPLLAQLFLEEINASGDKQVAGFAADTLDRLAAYPWPGNLDELAEVVRESHARAARAQITSRDLPKQIHLAADAAQRPRRSEEPIDLEAFLQSVEKELIDRALARSKGNKSKAARLLGLTRPRLYRRMVQLGLETEMFKPE